MSGNSTSDDVREKVQQIKNSETIVESKDLLDLELAVKKLSQESEDWFSVNADSVFMETCLYIIGDKLKNKDLFQEIQKYLKDDGKSLNAYPIYFLIYKNCGVFLLVDSNMKKNKNNEDKRQNFFDKAIRESNNILLKCLNENLKEIPFYIGVYLPTERNSEIKIENVNCFIITQRNLEELDIFLKNKSEMSVKPELSIDLIKFLVGLIIDALTPSEKIGLVVLNDEKYSEIKEMVKGDTKLCNYFNDLNHLNSLESKNYRIGKQDRIYIYTNNDQTNVCLIVAKPSDVDYIIYKLSKETDFQDLSQLSEQDRQMNFIVDSKEIEEKIESNFIELKKIIEFLKYFNIVENLRHKKNMIIFFSTTKSKDNFKGNLINSLTGIEILDDPISPFLDDFFPNTISLCFFRPFPFATRLRRKINQIFINPMTNKVGIFNLI